MKKRPNHLFKAFKDISILFLFRNDVFFSRSFKDSETI